MLLILIFIVYVANGLPNSLLGSAWSAIAASTGAAPDAAGLVSMIIMAGPIVTNLGVGALRRRFSTRTLSLAGLCLALLSLVGFGLAKSPLWLYVSALPLGLGTGLVDAAITIFVTSRYEARQINWLNCCWGLGAMTGPVIMSRQLLSGAWRSGYFYVAAMQLAVAAALAASGRLWQGDTAATPGQEGGGQAAPFRQLAARPVFFTVIAVTMLYFGVELGLGLWGASYLEAQRGFSAAAAAAAVSGFYGALTAGRFVSGFLTAKMPVRRLVELGMVTMAAGLVLLIALPGAAVPAFVLYGLGCAPVFPSSLSLMKERFGAADCAAHMGTVLGISRVGLALLPQLIGKITAPSSFAALPAILLAMCAVMTVLNEVADRMTARRQQKERAQC